VLREEHIIPTVLFIKRRLMRIGALLVVVEESGRLAVIPVDVPLLCPFYLLYYTSRT
jgi:hypothetical protein